MTNWDMLQKIESIRTDIEIFQLRLKDMEAKLNEIKTELKAKE